MRFAVTMTVSPKLFKNKAEHQYDDTVYVIIEYLRKIDHMGYTLVAEITKNANIHYHMMIDVKDMSLMKFTKLFKDLLRSENKLGFSCVKLVDNEKGWTEYMLKDYNETYKLIGRPVIINDDLHKADHIDYPYKGYFNDEQ